MKGRSLLSTLLVIFFLILASGCSNPKKDWQEAEKLSTIEAYETFLQKHPQAQFADSARHKIEELEWQKTAGIGTIEAYETFLQKHPQAQFADSARHRIEELEWQKTVGIGTIEAYETFLQKYPHGENSRNAKFNSDVLKIIVGKIAPLFLYEGSTVIIIYDPSDKYIELKYLENKWQVLKSNVREVKHGQVLIVGRAKAGATIPLEARWRDGSIEYGLRGTPPRAGKGGVMLAIRKQL